MKNCIPSMLVGLALAFGIGLTLWGLLHTSWASTGQTHILFILVSLIVIAVINRFTSKSSLLVVACLVGVITLAFGAIWPLLVTILFALASTLLGEWFLRKLSADIDNWVFQLLVGAGLYGTVVGLLAHFPVNYPGVYGVALATPFFLAQKNLQQKLFVTKQWISQSHQPGERTSRWLEISIAVVALLHCMIALMPEVGHDALAMHLFIPGHLSLRHEWGFDVSTYVWAVMPMVGDWIFSIGYMLAGETAARMINVGFIFVVCCLLRDLVMWAGGNVVGVRWAVLLFLTTPLTFTESSSLFIESVWAAFVVAGSLSVFKLLQSANDQNIQLPVAGFLLGGALAAKAVTFTILPVLLFLLVLWYRTWIRWDLIRSLALGLVLFFAVGAIPYGTAWHFTGNPVFPFFNQIFQSPLYPAMNFDGPSIFGKGLTWDVFYQATFHTEKFLESRPGATGFQWLLLFFPALLALLFSRQHRGVILFVVAGLSIALTFQSITYLRYVFPSFVWFSGGIGVALSPRMTDFVFVRRSLFIVGWVVIVLNLMFFNSGTYYGDLSLQPLLSFSGREIYLSNRLPIRNSVELVNRLNVGRTPVAVFSHPLAAGLNSDAFYPTWYNYRFQVGLDEAQTSDAIALLLFEKGVDYVILDGNWREGEKRKIIEDATENLAELGTITVRKLKNGYRFQTELLTNPDFYSYDGWTLSSMSNNLPSKRITVSVLSPAYQVVSVVPGRRYQNSVTAVCADQPSQGRVQVNWLDSKDIFISTDIRVFDCTSSEVSHSMEVIAPGDASSAVVYASGHTNVPVILRKVSFKQ